MLTLPISMPRFKSIIFLIKIALKLSNFCKKKQNFRALGALPPQPRASGGLGLRPQTPSFRRLRTSLPDPYFLPAAGGSAPRPPNQPPIANSWLRAWLNWFSISLIITTIIMLIIKIYILTIFKENSVFFTGKEAYFGCLG